MDAFVHQIHRIAGLSHNAKLFLLTVSVSALGNGIFMLLDEPLHPGTGQ